jgi:hypothetical protein
MITLVFLIAAVAIDYTHWLSERRGVARAADLAALAATQDLPADPGGTNYGSAASCDTDSCTAAFEWAARNNYGEDDGAVVKVAYYCGNTIAYPPAGICSNENRNNAIGISPCPSAGSGEVGCDSLNITIEKGAVELFSTFFGGVGFNVGFSSWGSVSFRISPLDAVMSIDASGSMGFGCDVSQSNPGCPIREARIAADEFVTILLGDDPDTGNVQVGYAPYRGCYNPPSPDGNCVPSTDPLTAGNCNAPPASSWLMCLSKDTDLLRAKFVATQPGSSTNVCLGLWESEQILEGPGRNANPIAQRFVVILTDGQNAFQDTTGLPDDCIPNNGNGACNAGPLAGNTQRRLDECTNDVADGLKSAAVQVYVVGLNVAGTNNPSQFPTNAYCNGIGNGQPDNIANRRLLKCIASSTAGTNDHYFETNNAIELGDIFQGLAYEIAGRGLTAEPE